MKGSSSKSQALFARYKRTSKWQPRNALKPSPKDDKYTKIKTKSTTPYHWDIGTQIVLKTNPKLLQVRQQLSLKTRNTRTYENLKM